MRLALLLAVVAACGYPPLDGLTDGGNPPNDGVINKCVAPANYGSPTVVEQESNFFPGDQQTPDQLVYDGRIVNSDILFLALIDGAGAFPNQISAPVTIALTGIEQNFGTCSGCVLVAAGCNACDPSTGAGTAVYYMATGGTLKVTTVNPTLAGTLTNVTFTHVTIANTGTNPTFVTTPVNDGCATKIGSASFTAPVTQH